MPAGPLALGPGAPVEATPGFWSKFQTKGSTGWSRLAGGLALPILGHTIAEHVPEEVKGYPAVMGDLGGAGWAAGGPYGAAIAATAGGLAEGFTDTGFGQDVMNAARSTPQEEPWYASLASAIPGTGAMSAVRGFTDIANRLTKDRPEGPMFKQLEPDTNLSDVLPGGKRWEQPKAPERAKVPRTSASLTDYMGKVALRPEYQQKVLDNYTLQLETLKATGMKYTDPKTHDERDMTDEELNEVAWAQSVQMVPMLKVQQGEDEDFIRRSTAMQAAVSQQVPGLLTSANYTPEQLTNTQASLNMIPSFLSLGEYADRNRSMAAQIQQVRDMQALQALHPELFPSAQANSDQFAEAQQQAQQPTK